MAKYELTNGDYHLSSGARVPKSGLFIRSLKENKQTNFYIAPTTVNGTKASKLSGDKRLVLGRIYEHGKDIPDDEFKNALSLARQLAINLGCDLIVGNSLADRYKIAEQVVFKDLRLPMTFDEMVKMDNITISPRIDKDIYWHVPNKEDNEKDYSSYSYIGSYKVYAPESVKTKIDFSEIVQREHLKNTPFIHINSLDKDKKYSQDFSNIELVKIPEESYFDLVVQDENKFTQEARNKVLDNIKLPEYKGNIKERAMGIRNSEDRLVKFSTDLIKEMHKQKHIQIVNNDFRGRYVGIFQTFNRVASHNPDMSEDQKADLIIENLKELSARGSVYSSVKTMKEFSELKDFLEQDDIKELYHDQYSYIAPTRKAALPVNLNDFLRIYNKHKDLFEKVIEKGSPKPENNISFDTK